MTIKRIYETKEECVGLFIEENFDAFPSWTVTEHMCCEDWHGQLWPVNESLRFDAYETKYDDNKDEEKEVFCETHAPMWMTWFIPNWWVRGFVERHIGEVAEMGFTLIYFDDDLFAIGIDGAGYSFRDTHFTRLYDAMGIRWHEL